ncbi:MAG: DNA repair protein RadC [Alistipes sp.]|nr:DNA repair protein RadC [Alistipes sp.]
MREIVDRLQSRGAESLSDEELLSVILAESLTDERAPGLAAELLTEVDGSLMRLMDRDVARLRMVGGLGRLRALRLKAVRECGRRVAASSADHRDVVSSSEDVVRIMEPQLAELQYEECWALYLSSSGRVLERMRISQGGIQATIVDCRLVIKRALELLAVQIVLVHNHPSGSSAPSEEDRRLTSRVADAARLFDIRLLDHVVIARGNHYSFRGQGLIG